MKKSYRALLVCIAIAGSGMLRAKADTTLYSAPPDYTQFSYQSTSASGGEQEASPFEIATTASITSVTWWGDYYGNAIPSPLGSDSFTFSIYTGAGTPNSTADFTTSATDLSVTDLGFTGARGDEEFEYTADLSSAFSATAGTQYYLAILGSDSNFLWQFDGPGANFYRIGGDGTAWTDSGTADQDAFDLSGATAATPEPSSVALLGSGVLVLGFWYWKRSRWASAL